MVAVCIVRFVGGGETLPSSVARRFKEAGMLEAVLTLPRKQ